MIETLKCLILIRYDSMIFGKYVTRKELTLVLYLSIRIPKILFRLWKSLMGAFGRKQDDAFVIQLTAGKAAAIFLLNSGCCMINAVSNWNLDIWMEIVCNKKSIADQRTCARQHRLSRQYHPSSSVFRNSICNYKSNERFILWTNFNLYL